MLPKLGSDVICVVLGTVLLQLGNLALGLLPVIILIGQLPLIILLPLGNAGDFSASDFGSSGPSRSSLISILVYGKLHSFSFSSLLFLAAAFPNCFFAFVLTLGLRVWLCRLLDFGLWLSYVTRFRSLLSYLGSQ